MIVDLLKNIDVYKNISPDIYIGLKFIVNSNPDIQLGTYQINNNVKVFVTEYETKENFEKGFEAHKHVIDIQYPIIGLERIKWAPISLMDISILYDKTN